MLNLYTQLQQTLQKLLYPTEKYKQLKNQGTDQIQCAVGIILRAPLSSNYRLIETRCPYQLLNKKIDFFMDIQILLLQRGNKFDIYSGDICLPGGKKQKSQSIQQALFRQIKQQTGLNLSSKELIGILNRKFVAVRRSKSLFSTFGFVFFMKEHQQVKLNQQELGDYRWVSLRHFLKDNIYKSQKVWGVYSYRSLDIKYLHEIIQTIEFFAIDVGLKRGVFGLTLYVLSNLARLLNFKLLGLYDKLLMQAKNPNINKAPAFYEAKSKVQKCLQSCIRFKNQYNALWRVNYKPNIHLTEQQKQVIYNLTIKSMDIYYRQRPKF